MDSLIRGPRTIEDAVEAHCAHCGQRVYVETYTTHLDPDSGALLSSDHRVTGCLDDDGRPRCPCRIPTTSEV